MPRLIAIEGGGTSWTVAIAENKPDNLVSVKNFLTTPQPEQVLSEIRDWLRQSQPFDAIGIACFGPLDANPRSKTYGFITSTPKPGWTNTDVLLHLGLRDEFASIPFIFDTDVNAPAMAEYQLDMKAKGLSSCAYITVGTGVGVGLVVNGQTVHGLLHPEAGHVQVTLREDDSFKGTCPYHRTCIEGMCSTGALAARAAIAAADLPSLPDDHAVWKACAYYLALLCVNLVLTVSPEKISMGGGVMNRKCLYPMIRSEVKRLLNGYVQHASILTEEGLEAYIGPSIWDSSAGIVGAAFLAQIAAETKHS